MNKGMDGLLGFYDILNTQIAAISKSHVNLFVNNNNNNMGHMWTQPRLEPDL